MNTDTDIWFAFARTFGMLFIVLALVVLVFYLFRKFSGLGVGGQADSLIRVMAVHHLSPKEKLILVKVADQAILVGVSPAGMSKLASLDHCPDPEPGGGPMAGGFAGTLGRVLNKQKDPEALGKEASNG